MTNNQPLRYVDAVGLLRNDSEFRTYFSKILRDSSYSAYRWETPPVTDSNFDRPFEFVLLNDPVLERSVDAQAFVEHFVETNAPAVRFKNLRGDAELVVPTPMADIASYGHLANFVRIAPAEQVDDFWQLVATAMTERIGNQPVWLSTAGMGVSWLHVRLDSQPKYYGYQPYALDVTS